MSIVSGKSIDLSTKRILYCIHGGCYPPVQGDAVRVISLIEALRENGIEVHLAILHDPTQARPADYDALRGLCDGLSIYTPQPNERPTSQAAADIYCSDGFLTLCAQYAARLQPHAIIAQFSYLSRCLTLPGLHQDTLRVLDVDNILYRRVSAFDARGLREDWIRISQEEEQDCWRRAQLILTVQNSEAEIVRAALPDTTVITIPPLLVDRPLPASTSAALLFVGSDNPANRRGLLDFFHHTLPFLVERHPRLVLDVVGSVCDAFSDDTRFASAQPFGRVIRLHGVISDLTSHYQRAALVLNLVPAASGINVKLLEGLMHRRCVVSTREGISALGANTSGLAVAEIDQFGDLITRLLCDRSMRESLADNGYAMARRWLYQEAPMAPLIDRIRAVPSRPPPPFFHGLPLPCADEGGPHPHLVSRTGSVDLFNLRQSTIPQYLIVEPLTGTPHRPLLTGLYDDLSIDDICCLCLHRGRLLGVARVMALNADVLYLDRVYLAPHFDTEIPIAAHLLQALFIHAYATGKAVHGFPNRLLGIV